MAGGGIVAGLTLEGGFVPRVSDLIADRVDALIPLDLGEVAVTYRPKVITPAWQAAITTAERENKGPEDTLYKPLTDVLVSWDLEQDDGTVYPIRAEVMDAIPRVLLTSILLGVLHSARPNFARLAMISNGTSPAKADSAPSQTGTSNS